MIEQEYTPWTPPRITPIQRRALELIREVHVTLTVAKEPAWKVYEGVTHYVERKKYPVPAGISIRQVRVLEKRGLVRVEHLSEHRHTDRYWLVITGQGRIALGDWNGDEEDEQRAMAWALWEDLEALKEKFGAEVVRDVIAEAERKRRAEEESR